MRGTGRRWNHAPALVAVLALLSALALVLPSGAAAEPVVKGRTHLVLDDGLAKALRLGGVRVEKLREAKVQGKTVSLPIEGGEVELDSGLGNLEQEGGLRLVAGHHAVELTALRLDTVKRVLSGKVDGRRMQIAGFAGYRAKRVGFGDTIEIAALKPRPVAAATLNRGLERAALFSPTAPFASLSSSFKPQFDIVSGGALQLALDPRTLAKLSAAGAAASPFEAAAIAAVPPTYAASLTSGAIYPDLRGGSAGVEMGIRFQRESPRTIVSWLDLSVSLESNKLSADISLFRGNTTSPKGTAPIAALDFSGATARIDPRKRTVSITGARATLEASAAALLNEAFSKSPNQPVVASGDPLGELSLWMTGR
jgi:hypothetical protein